MNTAAPSLETAQPAASAGEVVVSIVIVNWNSINYVRQAIGSIRHWVTGLAYEMIVVDGGSFDGCGEAMAAEFPGVIFVQSQENIGFGRANNLGATFARGKYLLLLNPDTELRENSLLPLIQCLDSMPRAGAAGCRLLNADGSLQTSCVQPFPTVVNQILDAEFLRRRFPRSHLWGMEALYSSNPNPTPVEVISGACILVRRDLFNELGGFTPCYFMYGEDLDLCFKIKKSGREVYYVPGTSLVHFGGGSTDKSPGEFSNVMMRESVYRFLKRNASEFEALVYRGALGVSCVLRILCILPLLLIPRQKVVQHKGGSLRKWTAILRWCVGLAQAVVQKADDALARPALRVAAATKS